MHPRYRVQRGSCQNGRGPLRGFPRIRAIDLAIAFSGVSTSTGSLGSNPDPSATRATRHNRGPGLAPRHARCAQDEVSEANGRVLR
jgi:hypothetical protein